MVSSIGLEFYGSLRLFFRSLKSLNFKDMDAWEKWLYDGEEENDLPFPCLRQLIVEGCPELKGGCTLSLPSLVEINIHCCNEGFLKCLAKLTSMNKMVIREIRELVHFEGSLSTSWTVLEEMRIERCPQFKFIVGGDGGKRVPPNLKVLQIVGCGEFEKLPKELSELTSLNEMSIKGCEKLYSFPNGGLPASLRKLGLQGCPKMPQSQLISIRLSYSLVKLRLTNLEGLVSITKLVDVGSPLSRSLQKLKIEHCESLATLTDSLQYLSALSDLNLSHCPALEMEIFPSLPSNLSKFELDNCPKVKCLPYNMHHLTSLKTLRIQDCEGITSLSSRGGLPPNLEILDIMNCKNLNQPLEEWELRGLTALQTLSIWGEMECVDEMECFPPRVYDGDWSRFLPSSLLWLNINRMKKLGRVGGGLRHHLTSLEALFISNYPRLRWLPDDGLPDSLESFFINRCTDELEKKCMNLRLIPIFNEHCLD